MALDNITVVLEFYSELKVKLFVLRWVKHANTHYIWCSRPDMALLNDWCPREDLNLRPPD